MPPTLQVDLWPFDLESGVLQTDVIQTPDVRQRHRLMPPPRGRGITS